MTGILKTPGRRHGFALEHVIALGLSSEDV